MDRTREKGDFEDTREGWLKRKRKEL
jgi:hypothetical protein